MLSLALEPAEQIADGIWLSKLISTDVKRLGSPVSALGERSVLGIVSPTFEKGRLSFSSSSVHVLNIGTGDDVCVVDLTLQKPQDQIVTTSFQSPTLGDSLFIAACKRERMPDFLITAAQNILDAVRGRYPGQMKEGLNRKWVNSPDNFLALVIQPRDISFSVHVWGEPENFDGGSLLLKRDRSRYSRFKLSEKAQLPDAIRVVTESARMRMGY